MRIARHRLAPGLGVLCALVTACGGSDAPTAGPTATPTTPPTPTLNSGPKVTFADRDTPFANAGRDLQRNWRPYQVATVPGQDALDNTPPAPRVVNLTLSVPDDIAQSWGHALVRTAAWERWAIRASQPNLLRRLGRDGESFAGPLENGTTVSRPDCDLFPTQLILTENTLAAAIETDQYALTATYTGPGGADCSIAAAVPGSPARVTKSYSTKTVVLDGWLHSDVLLGDLWIANGSDECSTTCPIAPDPAGPAPVRTSPSLPESDTAITDATPALATAWRAYGVSYIPAAATAGAVPSLPHVDNETGGNVTDDQAATWEIGLFRDLAWQRWAFRRVQVGFIRHILGANPNADLMQIARSGGRTELPECAAFPQTVMLAADGPADLRKTSATATTAYHFDLVYAARCPVSGTLPDGSTKSVAEPHSLTSYGDLRSDPLLGTIWYPADVVSNDP